MRSKGQRVRPESAIKLMVSKEWKELIEEVDDWIFSDWKRAEKPADREKLYHAREGVVYMKRILNSLGNLNIEGQDGDSDVENRTSH